MPLTSFLRAKVPLFAIKPLSLLLFLPLFSLAQLKTISGVVTDETGTPLSNINVTVQGGTAGTKTDDNGRYTISAAPGSVLVFSSVNQETSTLTVDERTEYNINLKQKIAALNDVVVVGYGRQKKVN